MERWGLCARDFVRAAQVPGLALSSACFWSSSPQPPQPQVPETPWADEGGSVYHLTDEDFDQFVKEHSSVLVMFHAPCEWSLAPPHHILPSLSIGLRALGHGSRERLLVGCLLGARDALELGEAPAFTVHSAHLHHHGGTAPKSRSGHMCLSAQPGRPEPLPPRISQNWRN